jgi:hypothetical protein
MDVSPFMPNFCTIHFKQRIFFNLHITLPELSSRGCTGYFMYAGILYVIDKIITLNHCLSIHLQLQIT